MVNKDARHDHSVDLTKYKKTGQDMPILNRVILIFITLSGCDSASGGVITVLLVGL